MRPYYNYDDEPRDNGVRISFGSGWTRTVKALILVTAAALSRRARPDPPVRHRESILTSRSGCTAPNFLKGAVWQPVTSIFVHDPGGLWHLLLNMLGLYFFGGDVDRRLGRVGFLGLYFLSGIVGALLCLSYGDAPAFGASGAVLGVLAAFAMLFPGRPHSGLLRVSRARPHVRDLLRVRHRRGHPRWAPTASPTGHTSADSPSGFSSSWRCRGGRGSARPLGARRARVEADRSEAEDAELDRILEKVHREGITALSNQERDFLNLMSRKRR